MPKKCCVPGCKSNYDSTKEYVTVFQFPSDPAMRETWRKCIPRKNWTPTKSAVVCRKHFRACDMILSDTITDDHGVQRERPRKNPVLMINAYPCLFSGRPTVYLPVPAPQSQRGLEKTFFETPRETPFLKKSAAEVVSKLAISRQSLKHLSLIILFI